MIHKTAIIHPTSIVKKNAIIGEKVTIGPFCYIGSKVKIGAKTTIKSHVVINGETIIGSNNKIFQFVTIGETNQDLKSKEKMSKVKIGNNNCIRESSTIHRGSLKGGNITKIGNNNLLMVNTHIAHDCSLGDFCIISNNGTLGGHVKIDNHTIIGGMTAIHQFCHIGSYVMIGGCSGVSQNIPPYIIAQGNHANQFGINIKGLKRNGFTKKEIHSIKNAYNILYRSSKSLNQAKKELKILGKKNKHIKTLSDFLKKTDFSNRGIIR